MNQKNIFSIISVVLLLQGIGFYAMKGQIAMDSFPALDAAGHEAIGIMLEVVSAISIMVGIITWAVRSTPGVAGAYTLGFLVFLAITCKHLFINHINVPIPAVIIQVLIVLSCGYLWMNQKSDSAS